MPRDHLPHAAHGADERGADDRKDNGGRCRHRPPLSQGASPRPKERTRPAREVRTSPKLPPLPAIASACASALPYRKPRREPEASEGRRPLEPPATASTPAFRRKPLVGGGLAGQGTRTLPPGTPGPAGLLPRLPLHAFTLALTWLPLSRRLRQPPCLARSAPLALRLGEHPAPAVAGEAAFGFRRAALGHGRKLSAKPSRAKRNRLWKTRITGIE